MLDVNLALLAYAVEKARRFFSIKRDRLLDTMICYAHVRSKMSTGEDKKDIAWRGQH